MLNKPIEEIEKQGSVDEALLTEHLRRLREQTYAFQSKQQEDSVVLERFDFDMGETSFGKRIIDKTKIPVRSSYLFNIEYGFVAPQRKLRVKRANMLGVELSNYDISQNPNVFDKNYMVFIEGYLVDCVKIIVKDGSLTLTIPTYDNKTERGIEEKVITEWIRNKTVGTVYFFSNSEFNPLVNRREVLNKYRRHLSLQDSGIIESLDSDEKYLTFVTTNNLGFKSDLIYSPERDSLLELFKELDAVSNTQRAFINVYGFRNLSREVKLSKGEKFFQLPGYIMPVPTANIMVFRETPSGREFAYDLEVKRYYPNFYEIVGANDEELSILVFFSEQNKGVIGYKNELESYYKIVGNSVESFLEASDTVKNYEPFDFEFSIKALKESDYSSPLEFKLETLSTLADTDPSNLIDYIKNQVTTSNGLIMDLSKINLEDRIRTDNHLEVEDEFSKMEFDKERYLFTFKDLTEEGKYEVVYYIDGAIYVPDIVLDKGKYDYMYIPTDLIKPDSIIEIERFEVFNYQEETIFTSDNPTFTLEIEDNVTRNDVFIVDTDNKIIDPGLYDVYIINEEGEKVIFPVGDRQIIDSDSVIIEMKEPTLMDVDLTVHADRPYRSESFVVTEDAPSFSFDTIVDTNFNETNIRVYLNGRLVDGDAVFVSHSGDYLDPASILLGVPIKEGDVVTYEYTPDSMTKIFELKQLPPGNIVYLHGIIDRPFSLDYYDVYINGRKLNKDNIDNLSPYLIQIKDVQSTMNFAIYEKKHAADVVSPSPDSKSVIDYLWETDDRFKNGLLAVNTGSSNSEPDLLADIISSELLALKDLWNKVFTSIFLHINPDNDIPTIITDKYKRLFENMPIVHLNGETIGKDDIVEVLHINPDLER